MNTPLAVVLVETRNPLNIGAVARAMSNFGFFDLRLVRPYDLAFREAVSATHAADVLRKARTFENVATAVSDCSLVVGATGLDRRQPQHPQLPLEKASGRIREASRAGNRVALLFGSEKHGLSNEHFVHCHWLLHIPTQPDHESMNLGQAVAVCLYEMTRSDEDAPTAEVPERAASGAEIDRLAVLLVEILQLSGYRDFGAQPTAAEKTGRLLRRLNLRGKDPVIWTGMLRQILWRLNHPER